MIQFLLPQKRKFSVADIEDDTSASDEHDDDNDNYDDDNDLTCPDEELSCMKSASSWKPKIENLEISSRRCFEDWFQEQGDVIYERTRSAWLERVRDFYHQTNGLSDFTSSTNNLDRDGEYIIRHSYQVPVSQDRLRANGGITNYRGKFLWDNHHLSILTKMSGESQPPWQRYVEIVVDRICSTYCATELKQAHEKRQTDEVTQFLCSLGYQSYKAPAQSQTNASVLPPPGHFTVQCEIKSSTLTRISLKIDVAVTCPYRMGESSSAVLIELKSASDEANTSKRMKEEGERYAKAEQLMGELMKSHQPVIADWKVIIILSGYFTARAMEHFQETKANAACLWFDNGNYREPLRQILSRDHAQNNKYSL